MNESEHLLVCLAEKCAEIQQAVTKALEGASDTLAWLRKPELSIVEEEK